MVMMMRFFYLIAIVIIIVTALSVLVVPISSIEIRRSEPKVVVVVTLQSPLGSDDKYEYDVDHVAVDDNNTSTLPHIVHYTCFDVAKDTPHLVTTNNNNEKDDDDEEHQYHHQQQQQQIRDQKESCCLEIIQQTHHVDDNNHMITIQSCRDMIAKVPVLIENETYSAVSDDKQTLIPIYYMSIEMNLASSDVLNFERRLYDNKSTTLSPFHPTTTRTMTANDNDDNDYANYFSASLHSLLSPNGGMHRSFIHNLTLSIPSTLVNSNMASLKEILSSSTTETKKLPSTIIDITGHVSIFLPITNKYFIDLDDPFQKNDEINQACNMVLINSSSFLNTSLNQYYNIHTQCQIEVVPPTTQQHISVIDIEQPSFASYQHVIAFRIFYSIKVQIDSLKEDDTALFYITEPWNFQITFVPIIHLRYQSPILNNKDRYIPVIVQDSFIYNGTMIAVLQLDDVQQIKKSFDLDISNKSSSKVNTIIYVAAGLDRHHDLVMILTIVACLLGALQMIRDFSKVGRWY